MRVEHIATAHDSLRPHVYYAGTHLVPYLAIRNFEESEEKHLEFASEMNQHANSTEQLTNSSKKEKALLNQRMNHQHREELFQKLNFISGVHYSQINRIYHD